MVADYLHKNSQLALIISHLANKDLFCNRYYEVFFIHNWGLVFLYSGLLSEASFSVQQIHGAYYWQCIRRGDRQAFIIC
jgi:hypothetical protein